jgi:hypothetical protein
MLKITETTLEDWGKECVAIIQDNIKTMPVTKFGAMHASGRTGASVRYEVTPEGLKVYGAGHIFTVETGRKPGAFPNISAIRQWIDDKPIIPRDNISKNSLAFLIARSIARKGTLVHQLGGKSGVLSNVVNQDRIDKLKASLLFEFKTVVRSALFETV